LLVEDGTRGLKLASEVGQWSDEVCDRQHFPP